jgi:O-antigen/teichoic acid export membrane protein
MSTHAGALDRTPPALARRSLEGTWLVATATAVSGVLTYAFLIVAARTLGTEAYGQIGVLWGSVFIAAIVLFRPLEQTTSRAISDRIARGVEVRTVLRAVGLIAVVLIGAVVIAAAAGWSTLSDRLFRGNDLLTAMFVVGTATYGLSYLVRGLVGGVCWFRGYSLGLLADSAARLAFAIPLFVVASRSLAAAAIAAGGFVGAAAPLYVGRRHFRKALGPRRGWRFAVPHALKFAGPATVIAASDQLLVNGAPLLVVLGGGSGAAKAAGVVFAATMLVRAPVYVFTGLASAILPNLTRLHARNDMSSFVAAVARAVSVLAGLGALIVSAVAIAGPGAMRLYGSEYRASRGDLVLLAVGVACYLAAGTFSQALLSLDGGRLAAVASVTAAAVLVASYALSSGDALGRVSVSVAAAMATLALVSAAMFVIRVYRR